ncbi:MAG: cyclic nucleotide-binding domain-containing protein [Anaerolineae bacterium]|nr:cyclic nucleotide-binding domain-containing protein [Anaerolineae bacterium]
MINTLTQIDHYKLLQQTFPDLGQEDITTLLQASEPQYYPAGVDICREGDIGDSMFILAEGEVDVIVHASNRQEIHIDVVGANNYFGEMALLGETTRTATIRTCTACHTLQISHTEFLPIAHSNPTLLRALLRQIIGHLRTNDQAVIRELNLKNTSLEKAYEDLAAQEELRSQFIATLSHELRTPLTAIKGFLGLVNQGAMQGESLKVALDSITRNVNTMVGLTNDLLILYEMRPAAPEFAYVNLPDILIESLNTARETLNGQSAAVTLDIAPNIANIFADKRSLVLALRALIENAFKFNPDKKPVHIRAFCPTQKEVAISVTDQGIGIPQADLERIFEAFVRLEKEGSQQLFPGLGVGLTIAKYVVERHNGRIGVESIPQQGSTFTIYIPQ